MSGLNYIKMPRSVSEYTLMKGVTDFSNLKQFDVMESGYAFLTVVSTPRFMNDLAALDAKVANLQNGFVHILEGEFRGLSGLPDLEGGAGTLSNGVNEIQLLNNVSMDTSITVSMSFWERSGGLIMNYLNYYLTGIKDPYSKAKTYHGLVGTKGYYDPGPDYEVFTFLYYVTDNTMRKIEKAYLLANAQPINAPNGQVYNITKGQIDFVEVETNFVCYPIVGDQVNMYANMMLHNDLVTEDKNRMLVLDSNNYRFDVYENKVENDGRVSDILSNRDIKASIEERLGSTVQKHLGDNVMGGTARNTGVPGILTGNA